MFKKNILKRKLLSFYSKIVREKASPEYIARGWAIGMFYGCLIPFGLQLICSIPTALALKGSKVGAVVGTFITNHFTVFIIYPVQCFVGNRLIGGGISYEEIKSAMAGVVKHKSYEALLGLGGELVAAFFVGGALLTLVMTPLTYWGVKALIISHRNRKNKKTGASDGAVPKESIHD
ncbi:MAG: DUF2062 domain-containing protein [Victivallaceae bacterium]